MRNLPRRMVGKEMLPKSCFMVTKVAPHMTLTPSKERSAMMVVFCATFMEVVYPKKKKLQEGEIVPEFGEIFFPIDKFKKIF